MARRKPKPAPRPTTPPAAPEFPIPPDLAVMEAVPDLTAYEIDRAEARGDATWLAAHLRAAVAAGEAWDRAAHDACQAAAEHCARGDALADRVATLELALDEINLAVGAPLEVDEDAIPPPPVALVDAAQALRNVRDIVDARHKEKP